MTPTAPRRIIVEIEPSVNPISGRVLVPGMVTRPFAGWLQLIAALEAAHGLDEGEASDA